MSQHPRASELTRLIAAVEKAGKTVRAVEIEWRDNRPVWTLRTEGEESKAVGDVRLG